MRQTVRENAVQRKERRYFRGFEGRQLRLRYLSCCLTGVQFYDVLADGHPTALTRTQIASLFRAGQLACNDPCKEAEQAEWRTIAELFPLLKRGTSTRSLYQPTELHSPRSRVVALTAAISIFVISAGLLAGYFVMRSGSRGSRNAITAAAATNPRPPVTYTIENPYFRSQQERAAQERLKAAQRAREQIEEARLAQDRAAAERRERELQKATTERIPPRPSPKARK